MSSFDKNIKVKTKHRHRINITFVKQKNSVYKNVSRGYSLSDGIHARFKLFQTFAVFHTLWQINYTFKKQICIKRSERHKLQTKRSFR